MSEAWGAAYGQMLSLTRRLEHLEERLREISPNKTIKIRRLERARDRVKQRIADVQTVLNVLHV
jgi:hypothetical protein